MEERVLKKDRIISVLGYVFLQSFGALLISILLIRIFASLQHLDYDLLYALVAGQNVPSLTQAYTEANIMINCLLNFIIDLLCLGFVGFFMRRYWLLDAREFKNNYKFLLIYIPITSVLMYLISFGIENLIPENIGVSENQNLIVEMIRGGGGFYMFVATVLFAPIIEELIFRKAIFEFLKKMPRFVPHLVSVIIFAGIHMLSTSFDDMGKWCLLAIPYLTSAIMLCLIYEFSKQNIYASWFAHFLNNLIAFILIMI